MAVATCSARVRSCGAAPPSTGASRAERSGYRCAVTRCSAAVLWSRAAGARCNHAVQGGCGSATCGGAACGGASRRRSGRNGWRRGRDCQRRTGSLERLVRHRPAARAEDDGHGRTAREQPCRSGADPRVPEPCPPVLRTEQVPDRPLRRPRSATMRRHLTSPRVDRRRSCVVRLSRGVTITSTPRCENPTLTRRRDRPHATNGQACLQGSEGSAGRSEANDRLQVRPGDGRTGHGHGVGPEPSRRLLPRRRDDRFESRHRTAGRIGVRTRRGHRGIRLDAERQYRTDGRRDDTGRSRQERGPPHRLGETVAATRNVGAGHEPEIPAAPTMIRSTPHPIG